MEVKILEKELEKADKYAKRGKLWEIVGNYKDKALDIYDHVATQYKLLRMWGDAAKVYEKAALITSPTDNFTRRELYTNAAKAYKNNSDTINMLRCYKIICELAIAEDNLRAVAISYKEIGETQEKENLLLEAIASYESANKYFLANGSSNSDADKVLIRVAEIAIKLEDYKKAYGIYEKISETLLDNSSMTFIVPDYLFKAGICRMADVKSTDNTFLERYKNLDPKFDESDECKLLESCIKAIDEINVDDFTNAIAKYEKYRASKLVGTTIKMLYKIKKLIIDRRDNTVDADVIDELNTGVKTDVKTDIDKLL
ncbi:MAG: alpha-soluble NSF attachment protein [Edafosvirus sp.]|uniref:Alpha-soluble NSF attachment protein n=1 Tax=Edafosvirus sp. TaxID=2487765 RepID=A0A3G4ZVC7_9VIRU|nr:MAG: alpha-soluble NSF attachment protein [Edafosvirus sp.]